MHYPKIMVGLHWLMAFMVLGMLGSGLAVGSDLLPKMASYQVIQWHKAFGVAVLGLVLIRVAVRVWATLAGKIPPLPKLPRIEQLAASLGHFGLYALMLLMPLTGWLMVSASPYGLPTILFGSVQWPHIPWVVGLNWVNELAGEAHEWLGWALLALVVVHSGAVVKHYVQDNLNLLPRMWLGLVAVLLLWAPEAQALPYNVLKNQSVVAFQGTHAGAAFQGTFGQWDATITFDPANLATSKLHATFQLASAKTGNPAYDGALPTADWFDVANHPTGTFTSQSITAGAQPNAFVAAGTLTLKGISQPVQVPFTLAPQATGNTLATATFTLDRLAFGLGKQSDPKAEWVSREITLTLTIVAQPATAP